MSRSTRLVTAALVAALSVPALAQAPVAIKLASIVPANSVWHDALRGLREDWLKRTNQRVTLTMYVGGTRGTEPTYIRLMRLDDLQAALLLPPGLAEIDESFNVLGMPFFFESDEEMRHVLARLTPVLASRLEARGFRLINWGSAGWVQLFSKMPVRSLDDLKRGSLYTTKGNDAMVQWYKSNGFNPVPLEFNDIPGALKSPTGGLEIVPSPPMGASTMFFRDAPNMLEIRVAPLISAIIMSERAWNRLAPADRTAMLDAAGEMERRIMTDASAVDAKSIGDMKARGLRVHALDAKAEAEFRAAADQLTRSMRGGMVPADVFDLAVQERNAFRKTRGR